MIVRLALALLGLAAVPAAAQSISATPIEALHTALHLTPPQETAWKAYRGEASAPNRALDRRRAASQMFPSLSSPQRLDLVEAEMKEELRDLERQSRALKAFYATLDPAQQRTFDAQTLPPQGNDRTRP